MYFCPPIKSAVPLRELLTVEERLHMLEDRLVDKKDFMDYTKIQELDVENLEQAFNQLNSLKENIEHRLDEFQKLINMFQGKFQYLNTLSKKIVTLEESSKSKGINSNKEPF